ncbi:ATP-dependent DNA ligase [Granulicella sp. L46]|uniref:ATP-dependent DNA ligase n=1 Tax=Granulicella sp. L46 TaxID=1641865 RepID=UPI0020B167E6|nr:ATP-dependent DNA ligase [Granulicella sp. L46]
MAASDSNEGAMALFLELATLAEELAREAGRLKKRALIEIALGRVVAASVEDAGRFCLYLAGQPFAEADPRKLNAGGALLTRAVKAVSGCSDAALTGAYRRHGDLGAAAAEVWPGTLGVALTESLTLAEVAEVFGLMAVARTTAVRADAVERLLRRASAPEAKYLLKLMLGDMRIGVKQSLIEEAIGVASGADVVAVRHAVMLEADLAGAVGRAFGGTLGEARMRLFHPLGFMLASPVETPEEAVERFTSKDSDAGVHAFLEDKYDGMRAQVHCGDPGQPGRVAVYSRNREDITESFPEIAEAFREVSEPLILDGELLGWNVAESRALPFSVLGQRIGRKRVDSSMRRQVPVVFMVFDLLYEGGELVLPLPLRERRGRLEAVVERLRVVTVAGWDAPAKLKVQAGLFDVAEEVAADAPLQRLMLSPTKLVESVEAIEQAYVEARAQANEGVMLKAAGSAYLPGRRGLAWVKLKRELATLDVVITGAEFGHGRRAGLLSDYTFAVRGNDGELLNVGKAYSGVTDVEIAELTEWMKAHTIEDYGHFRTVEPLRVIEVAFNNVMRSDRHASGFALRFPRILRLREDKPLEEIDTLERVEEIYEGQPDKPPVEGAGE